jgi:hypothetical protein
MAQTSYQLINLITDIELTWPFTFAGAIVVYDVNDIDASQNGWTIAMPDATLGVVGQYFRFNNVSGFTFEIVANDLTTVLATVTAGQVIDIYLIDISTMNGTWRVISPPSVNAITQITAESTDNTIVITNGVVTPPTGVINFELPTSLFNLLGLGSPNFLVVNSNNPLTFSTVSLVGGTNITVNDGTGLSGNVIIDLPDSITGLSSVGTESIDMTGVAIISNTDTNGNLQITTNGTGKVQLNGISIDVNGNITGINNFVAPRAYCVFTDTLIGIDNVIVIGSQTNISSVTGSGGVYTINFTTAMTSANYGVLITIGSTGGVLPFVSNAYFIVRTLTSVTIEITDASGSLVLSAPYGVTVMIMSN